MAEIKSESVADFIPESVADFPRNTHYTVLETAKLNGLDPEAYLADIIDRMAKGHPINRLVELLPWSWLRPAARMAA